MAYFDAPDRTQSVSKPFVPRPTLEFIGDVRRRLFIAEPHEWNGVVRDITAQMERPGMLVNAELICVHIAEYYRIKAHWARFKQLLVEDGEGK